MAVVLFVNSYDLRVFANTDYNHNELLEYEGYAEAMYESIVEQTTFISGRYTENKDYVNESINEITDYAKGWWDEYLRISNMEPKEKIREMLNAAGGYALTVGDFIKNLFSDKEKLEPPPPELDYYSVYKTCFEYKNGEIAFNRNPGCKATVHLKNGTSREMGLYFNGINVSYTYTEPYRLYVYIWDTTNVGFLPGSYNNVDSVISLYNGYKKSFNSLWSALVQSGIRIDVEFDGKVVQKPIGGNPRETFYKYIKDNPVQVVTPKPTAYLSCPDGTRINMKINGGTFLDVKGNIMSVDKNGTATIDSQICNLGWEKPKVGYIDETDQIGITTPDGEIKDVETGETIVGGGDDGFDDEIKDGCGTLCALGKLLTGLGSIAKAIAAIPLKILDGLLELVKKIFIPEENFWTTNLDGLKNKFFHDELKEVQNGVESLESVGGGQFGDVTGSLMGVDNLTIIDSSSINMSLEKIHSWVRGFFYPLLLFFNINQMYRVIRGTSLIGIGGKKEE